MRIDFHVHGDKSPCSVIRPRIAVKAAKKQGLDAIALINHDKLVKHEIKGFKIINGQEVSTTKGHIIGLNINKEIKKGIEPQKAIDQIKKQGGFVIIPHPFDKTRKGVGKELSELRGYDAIEVNGRCLLKRFNEQVRKFAKENKTALIGGSDAHFYPEIGVSTTEVKTDDITDALRQVKKGKAKIIINGKSLLQHRYYAYSWLVSLKKRLILK